jgi:hypothetical protein
MPCAVFNAGDDLSGFNPFYEPTYLEKNSVEVLQLSHVHYSIIQGTGMENIQSFTLHVSYTFLL